MEMERWKHEKRQGCILIKLDPSKRPAFVSLGWPKLINKRINVVLDCLRVTNSEFLNFDKRKGRTIMVKKLN